MVGLAEAVAASLSGGLVGRMVDSGAAQRTFFMKSALFAANVCVALSCALLSLIRRNDDGGPLFIALLLI